MSSFAQTLTDWFRVHCRDLPWRNVRDPYAIWVSEIILQQTRVAQGTAYYHRFLQRFPTVETLAAAPLEDVLKVWQGLGYYTRARNMHRAAQQIATEYNGKFPNTEQGLRSLRGIGDYTTAAIGSFAFGLPLPAIDGNVYRVVSRIYGIRTPIDTREGREEIRGVVQKIFSTEQPALFNQALMDFGACCCTPKSPQCEDCAFARQCYALKHHCITLLPVKSKQIKVRTRYFSYLIIRCKGKTFVRQRLQNDIWHSLYEFPLIETATLCSLKKLQQTPEWLQLFDKQQISSITTLPSAKHQLTHQCLQAQFFVIDTPDISPQLTQTTLCIPFADIEQYPMPQLLRNVLESSGFMIDD
ncbi:A/G-specific adenine glycosylase [Bacteroidia bacterium]|nr:A/G-specific adenine glycosylase [Bacteroidia bacterium]